MKHLFSLILVVTSLACQVNAQKPQALQNALSDPPSTCTGSPGRMTVSFSNISSSSITLTVGHSGATGVGWSGWSDQVSYKLNSDVSFGATTPVNGAITISGLIPGRSYDFLVEGARLCARDGQSYPAVPATPLSVLLPPAVPAPLAATNIGSTSFTANWQTNGVADHFYVDVSTNPLFSPLVYTNLDAAANTSLSVTGISLGLTYYYRIRASNGAGTSANSNISFGVTTVLPTPGILSPDSIQANSFNAKWTPVPGASHLLDVATDPGFASFVPGYNLKELPPNTASVPVIGLAPSTMHYYRVMAVGTDGIGASGFSGTATAGTSPSGATGGGSDDPFSISVLPPSPEAAALAKYADVPVNLYTGTPEISIPIYTLQEGGLSLPITLNYHGGGNKVDDIAPRTGLGWTLGAGGVVTRTMMGWADEFSYKGYLAQTKNAPLSQWDTWSNLSKDIVFNKAVHECIDLEPDVFQFNFAGYTGKFMFADGGQIKTMSSKNIKIEPIGLPTGDFDFIDGWTITGEDGTIFTFTAMDSTDAKQNGTVSCKYERNEAQDNMPTAWYLTEIKSADGKRWIHFNYTQYKQFKKSLISDIKQYDSRLNELGSGSLQESNLVYIGQNLSSITTSSGQSMIEFFPSIEPRTDVSDQDPERPGGALRNNYALGKIKISSASEERLSFSFAYTYSTGRLTLASLTETAGAQTKPPYLFSYYPGMLPETNSYSVDHWGFFNAKPNTNANPYFNTLIQPLTQVVLLPQFTPSGQPNGQTFQVVRLSGQDRSPDRQAVLYGMLNSIEYPAGGKRVFEFEPNDYSFRQSEELKTDISIDAIANANIVAGVQKYVDFSLANEGEVLLYADYTFDGTGNPPALPLPHELATSILQSNTWAEFLYLENRYKTNMASPDNEPVRVFLPKGNYRLVTRPAHGPTAFNLMAKVIYKIPTGETTTDIRQGPGVRIARISSSSGNGSPDMITKYTYSIAENGVFKSSGSLSEGEPIYSTFLPGGTATGPDWYLYRYAQSKTAFGSPLGYGSVIETYGNGDDGSNNNGKCIYQYSSSRTVKDIFSLKVPFPPSASFEYARGLLLTQTHFNTNNDTLKRATFTYQKYRLDIPALKIGWAVIGPRFSGPSYLSNYAVGNYFTPLGYVRMTQMTTKEFFPNTPSIQSTATFTYNEDIKQPVSSTVTNSLGKTLVTAMRYPSDFPALKKMTDLHIMNRVVETLTWQPKPGSTTGEVYLQSGIKTDFGLNNGFPVPTVKGQARISIPPLTTDPFGTASRIYGARITYNKYDTYNNLTEHAMYNGMKTCYQWNYAGTLPTAKVDNAASNQIFFESFEEDGSATSTQQRTGLKSKAVSGIYTIPTANLPGVTGNYVLSYWAKEGNAPWLYKEKVIPNYSLGSTIGTDAVNGFIDDVRLYPSGAMMTTYTYKPLVGMTSITDPSNVTVFYEYDVFGRLKCARDQDKNIMKAYDYQFKAPASYNVSQP